MAAATTAGRKLKEVQAPEIDESAKNAPQNLRRSTSPDSLHNFVMPAAARKRMQSISLSTNLSRAELSQEPSGKHSRSGSNLAPSLPSSASSESLLRDRKKVSQARRVIVKVSTKVISRTCDGRLALGRIGGLIEQLELLVRSGRQVVLVTSGAVCSGRQRIRRESILNSSPLQLQALNDKSQDKPQVQRRAAAACGQSALMSLYDLLFAQMDLAVSQLLVTRKDFESNEFVDGLKQTADHLLAMNIVPVVNWNDAIERMTKGMAHDDVMACGQFVDNNALALLLAEHLNADLMVLLSDIDCVKTTSGEEIRSYCPNLHKPFVDLSCERCGCQVCPGMQSKVDSAWSAAQKGIPAIVADGKGSEPNLLNMVAGKLVGTLFDQDVANKIEMQDEHNDSE